MAEVIGNDGAERLFGTSNADTISGMAGDDRIVARGGADLVYGDGANGPGPTIGPPAPGALVPGANIIAAGGGADTVIAGYGSDNVDGGGGDDRINGSGPLTFVYGPHGIASEIAADRADVLDGGSGNDVIDGAGGSDSMFGRKGQDTLVGSYGADTLTGGAGNDIFAYGRLPGFSTFFAPGLDTGVGEGQRDVVTDFVQGSDQLDLSAFRSLLDIMFMSQEHEGIVFIGSEAFSARPAMQVRAEIAGDQTIVQFQITSYDNPYMRRWNGEIELAGNHHLIVTDFIL